MAFGLICLVVFSLGFFTNHVTVFVLFHRISLTGYSVEFTDCFYNSVEFTDDIHQSFIGCESGWAAPSNVKDHLLASMGLVRDLMSLTIQGLSDQGGGGGNPTDTPYEHSSSGTHPSEDVTGVREAGVTREVSGGDVNETEGGVLSLPVTPLLSIISALHRELTNVLVNKCHRLLLYVHVLLYA